MKRGKETLRAEWFYFYAITPFNIFRRFLETKKRDLKGDGSNLEERGSGIEDRLWLKSKQVDYTVLSEKFNDEGRRYSRMNTREQLYYLMYRLTLTLRPYLRTTCIETSIFFTIFFFML